MLVQPLHQWFIRIDFLIFSDFDRKCVFAPHLSTPNRLKQVPFVASHSIGNWILAATKLITDHRSRSPFALADTHTVNFVALAQYTLCVIGVDIFLYFYVFSSLNWMRAAACAQIITEKNTKFVFSCVSTTVCAIAMRRSAQLNSRYERFLVSSNEIHWTNNRVSLWVCVFIHGTLSFSQVICMRDTTATTVSTFTATRCLLMRQPTHNGRTPRRIRRTYTV